MNYIAEIKAFYDRIELNPLPSPAIALWHALMSIANKTGWQQEFTVSVSVLVLKSGLNAQAIKRARNRLEQDGFITWRSRGGNQSAVYGINSLVVQNSIENVPQYEPQSVPQTVPQTDPQCEPQSVPINKHKQKRNETYIPPLSPTQRFEEFLSAYPKDCNRYLTETAYDDLLLTGKITEDELVQCAQNYAEACRIEGVQFMYNAENFLKKFVFEKYLPGRYKKPDAVRKTGFNDFRQNDYDFDQLEREIVSN